MTKTPCNAHAYFQDEEMINEYDIKHMSEDQKLCLKIAEEAGIETTYLTQDDIFKMVKFMRSVAEHSALVALEHQQFSGALAIRNYFNVPPAAPCALLDKRFTYGS